uniref:Protein FAM107B-like n=1 Tax=Acanthochromis polyacanthus TaxID=80966 RepID=A0A3Q1G5S4_9TELE
MLPPRQVIENQEQEDDDLIKARKLPNPILASHQHRALHQELLFCHRRGVLPRRKPELQCVLEHKQREQHKQRELALHPPSDLEVKLRTRLQRLQVVRTEEERKSEECARVCFCETNLEAPPKLFLVTTTTTGQIKNVSLKEYHL